MGKKPISKEKLLKLGYLFEFDEVDKDKKLKYGEWKYIKEYLKSRIKDFYFLYKKSANIGGYNVNLSVINKENSEVNYLNDTESLKIDYKIKLNTKFKENIHFKNKLELDEDNNATITSYEGNMKNLEIPETIDDYPVVAIGSDVFAGNSLLSSVTFPASVKEINSGAFRGCSIFHG